MGKANEPQEAFILSDLLRDPNKIPQDRCRPGIQTSLRSGLFPNVKTNYDGISSSEPRIHAVGLNLRSICKCSLENDGISCGCFQKEDLSCRGLLLSKNNLTGGQGLEMFQNLRTLSLADNLFDHIPRELQSLVNLKRFNFAGNRMAEATPHYRERILAYSPSICELDGVKISTDEVKQAQRTVIEECILTSLIFLLHRLTESQYGPVWEEDYDKVCRQIEEVVGKSLATENIETVEEFICSLKEYFLHYNMLGEDTEVWLEARPFLSKGASSWNHAIAMLAVDLWNDITYPAEWNQSCFDDFVDFARGVTTAIDLLEVILRGKNGHSSDVQDTAMEVWSRFYILVSNFKAPSVSIPECTISADEACVESSPLLEYIESCSEEAESEEPEDTDGVSDMMLELQTVNDRLKEKLESYMMCNDKLSRDKQEMTVVLTLLQENLEDMNKKKAEVISDNQALLDRLYIAEYDGKVSLKKLKELQSAYDEYRRDISSQLNAQESQFTSSISLLMKQLDALEKEPRIPVHIEIVNPDIRRSLEERDEAIKWMKMEIDLYQRHHKREITADTFSAQWRAQRLKNAIYICFAAWRRFNKYSKSLKLFQISLEAISRQRSRQDVSMMLSQWLATTIRSKKVGALSGRVLSRTKTSTTKMAFEIWHMQYFKSMRVRSFTKVREERSKQHVLEILWLHKCLWEQRTKEATRIATLFHNNRLKLVYTKVWVETYRSEYQARENILQKSHVNHRLVGNAFASWRHYSTKIQIEALGRAFSNHRIASKSFHALVERSRRAKALKLSYARLVAWKRRQTCEIVAQCWKDQVKGTKDLVSHNCLIFWYNTALLQRYIRHCAAVQEEKNKAAMRHALSQWRAHSWGSKHHKLKSMCTLTERLKCSMLLRQCFTSWVSTLLRHTMENQDIIIENMDANVSLLVSSCNSMKTKIAGNHIRYLQEMNKASTESHITVQKLKKQQRVMRKRLTMFITDTSRMKDTIKDLEAIKSAQDGQIISLQQGMEQLERDKYLLELRLRASETIKASVSTRAKRALKTSSIATDTLLSVWQQYEPFSVIHEK